MSTDKSSSGNGCLIWFLVLYLLLSTCDSKDKIKKLEKRIQQLETRDSVRVGNV